NYFPRQVDRWTKQYRASETQHIPEFEKLAEWLPKTVPEQTRVSIVHGDYRLDNMIFHATEPRVQAVLDWELSTLGDPMADFTYLLMQWVMPGLDGADLKALNIPSVEEAAQIYCNVTQMTVPDLNWYFAYNLFRLAGVTPHRGARRELWNEGRYRDGRGNCGRRRGPHHHGDRRPLCDRRNFRAPVQHRQIRGRRLPDLSRRPCHARQDADRAERWRTC